MTDPQRRALVLVDVVPPSSDDPDIFRRLGTALTVARRAGMRIVHVWSAPAGGPPPTTDPEVDARRGEPVLPNPGAGAWSAAGLGRTLVDGGIESIVLAGRADRAAWWATVEESAAQPIPLTVLSDRNPQHDLRVRQLIQRDPGQPGARLMDTGAWVAETSGTAAPPVGRRRAVLLGALALVLLLLVVGGVVVSHDAKGYYEFAPGTAPTVTASSDCRVRGSTGNDLTLPDGAPCARLVVPATKVHAVSGRLFMVDVLVGPASPVDFVLDKLGLLNVFHKGNQLVPAAAVLGSTPASQLSCLNAQEMTGSTQDAAVAALDRLGYSVKENDLGALVVQVSGDSAAARAGVQCNDVITGIDGTPVHTYADLVDAIHARKPGDVVTLEVDRPGANGSPTATRTLHATLTGTPAQPAANGQPGVAADPSKAFLGVGTETQLTYTLPFDVSIQVGNIGGPSAGLALTLGLLDTLSNGQLTGGRPVAATGTISPDGTVGDVGGVAQKTIAVRRAGAKVFLVPDVEYSTAEKQAGGALQVLPVSSLNQALTDLEHLGGTLGPLAESPHGAPKAATAAPTTTPTSQAPTTTTGG